MTLFKIAETLKKYLNYANNAIVIFEKNKHSWNGKS